MYDKRDDFDFDIVNFPSFDGDIHVALECVVMKMTLMLVINARN